MGSFTNSNMDNLLLQTMMGIGRLQVRPPNNTSYPFLPQSLEDLLFEDYDLGLDEDDDESKTSLAREESRLEKEIIRIILSGQSESLRPNSGQAVSVSDHHVCVSFHIESGSDYRVWEWHGHIMLFDDDNGYTPEYIYGNYFERLQHPHSLSSSAATDKEEKEKVKENEKEKSGNLGLRELIDDSDSGPARVLHRNINAASSRV